MSAIVGKILNNHIFKRELERIYEYEKNRIYCHHDLEHLFSVCRIAYIYVLENYMGVISTEDRIRLKDNIYAAGLLHDIGRAREYETGVDHDRAGMALAREILVECNMSENDVEWVLQIIGTHRGSKGDNLFEKSNLKDTLLQNSDIMSEAIGFADRKSRNCFCCQAASTCKWPKEKKNTAENILI